VTDAAIHVIDDDEAVREALCALLEAAGFQVTAYACAEAFLASAAELQAGCVLSDVRMPGLSGLELLQRLQDDRDRFAMIMLTGEADVPMAVEALKSGALDFIEKPFEDSRILGAVRAATQALAERARQTQGRSEYARRLAELTAREKEVLDHLVLGRSSKAIGRELGISPRTVDVYRANIMNKTRAGTLAELVRVVLLVNGTEA
jgi:two-component system response regulator FixJ